MKKKFPKFKTDAETEAFVDTTGLTGYDVSDMVLMRFELRHKDKSISLRLLEKLLDAVRISAKDMHIPYQRFMRPAIEKAVHGLNEKRT